MPQSGRFGSGFAAGAFLGIIVGLVLGGNNTLKIIVTGQGSVGCAGAGDDCQCPYMLADSGQSGTSDPVCTSSQG